MIVTLMLAAVQAAAPVPPAPPAAGTGDRTIVREIFVRERPGTSADSKDKRERREIIVIRSGEPTVADGKTERRVRIVDIAPGKPGERRGVRILREPGAAGARIAMLDCDSGSKVDSETTGADGKKTRVMVCAQGGNQIEALERASKRIAENKELPDDVRARVLARVNDQITRLKAGK